MLCKQRVHSEGEIAMIKDIMTANELVTQNQKEINVLKQNFPSCFSADGTFDIVKFSEFLKDKVTFLMRDTN